MRCSGAAGFLRVLGWMQGVWESGRVFWSGTMGRAEVRGNQQQQECSSGRQKTGQDAGCSGRRTLGGCGNGSLESCAQSNSSAQVEQAKEASWVPLLVRHSAQHQEGPSRSCSASGSASARGATTQEPRRSPSTDHGTASLAYINNVARYFCSSCVYATITPSTDTAPLVDSQRQGRQPPHRFFSSHT